MALPTSKTSRAAISLEAFGRDLARRREALGEVEMPRNSGRRRTESKRALLAAIEATGKRW
ncbi:hypothetical protein [Sphingomonas cavernae]|uniref:Uncharacterized protein n=1 Tax=Sphingomonas cavernae TaxID=2320861 RepID=A0A418WRX7_9SPHN|nr:hypothetical protein [Sphingomonas cavernae]RJF93946.1 hypothetical protein D3876_06655 [Sphingomonas cavernae]